MARTAQGRLSFERAGRLTASRVVYAESPLRLLTPRSRGSAALAFTSTFGGGLLDGDGVRLDVSVGADARAWVCTQGPTRVFSGSSSNEVAAAVGEGAALVLAPDPVACFAGARFEQRTAVELAADASLSLWEVISGGRDRWGFARCRSALAIRRAGEPLIDEAWLLDSTHGPLASRMGRFEALATLVLAGPLFSSIRERVRQSVSSAPLVRGARVLQSASPLGADALIVRLAGASVEEAMRALRGHLAALPDLLGVDPWRRDALDAA